MFVGGDILEISYKHPTLGTGTWFPKSGEDLTVDPGGYRSEDKEDGITGDGQMIDTINRKRWSMEGSVAWDTASQDEVLQAAKLGASPVLADWTFTHINGTIWGGKGKVVGEVKGSSKDATMKLKVAGGGVLSKIS
jgi:hypothetical protein